MKVLMAHNRYRLPGGEDTVFESERDLLRSHGHHVDTYEISNTSIADSIGGRLAVAGAALVGGDGFRGLVRALDGAEYDICHFYNTFPLITPNAYRACRASGTRVVQTVQNYRFICPGALLYRDGRICDECVGRRFHWPGVRHGCYRGSTFGSGVVASVTALHRALGSFDHVDRFIAATEFSKEQLAAGGIPAERIAVKPNFTDVSDTPRWIGGDDVLFVGRLTTEKGVHTLLRAWPDVEGERVLRIAGDGPERSELEGMVGSEGIQRVEFLGWLDQSEVDRLMRESAVLVVPSEWYEGFPTTIARALGMAVPVVGSDLGGVGEILRTVDPGSVFPPGDSRALARVVSSMVESREARSSLSRAAERAFEERYTPARNYEALMRIYSDCLSL